MISETHDLEENCLHNHEEMASAAIDYLTNFAFYTCSKVVEPKPLQITTINFKIALKTR